jgi:hypothetical protein
VEDFQVFSQNYYGTVISDTTIIRYTISKGNVIRVETTQGDANYFEYSARPLPDKHPALNFWPSGQGSFPGKPSQNLVSKMKMPMEIR